MENKAYEKTNNENKGDEFIMCPMFVVKQPKHQRQQIKKSVFGEGFENELIRLKPKPEELVILDVETTKQIPRKIIMAQCFLYVNDIPHLIFAFPTGEELNHDLNRLQKIKSLIKNAKQLKQYVSFPNYHSLIIDVISLETLRVIIRYKTLFDNAYLCSFNFSFDISHIIDPAEQFIQLDDKIRMEYKGVKIWVLNTSDKITVIQSEISLPSDKELRIDYYKHPNLTEFVDYARARELRGLYEREKCFKRKGCMFDVANLSKIRMDYLPSLKEMFDIYSISKPIITQEGLDIGLELKKSIIDVLDKEQWDIADIMRFLLYSSFDVIGLHNLTCDFIDYFYNTCKIAQPISLIFSRATFSEYLLTNMGYAPPKMMFNDFTTRYIRKTLKASNTDKSKKLRFEGLIARSYYGGLVLANYVKEIAKDVSHYDFNSYYATLMSKWELLKPLKYERVNIISGKEIIDEVKNILDRKDLAKYCLEKGDNPSFEDFSYLVVIKTTEKDAPILPFRTVTQINKRRLINYAFINSRGKNRIYKLVYMLPDLIGARLYNPDCQFEIEQAFKIEFNEDHKRELKDGLLIDHVINAETPIESLQQLDNHYKKQRHNYQKNGDLNNFEIAKGKRNMIKNCKNSMYGKCLQRTERKTEKKDGSFVREEWAGRSYFSWTASLITSMARLGLYLVMYKLKEKAGEGILYYCDSDSFTIPTKFSEAIDDIKHWVGYKREDNEIMSHLPSNFYACREKSYVIFKHPSLKDLFDFIAAKNYPITYSNFCLLKPKWRMFIVNKYLFAREGQQYIEWKDKRVLFVKTSFHSLLQAANVSLQDAFGVWFSYIFQDKATLDGFDRLELMECGFFVSDKVLIQKRSARSSHSWRLYQKRLAENNLNGSTGRFGDFYYESLRNGWSDKNGVKAPILIAGDRNELLDKIRLQQGYQYKYKHLYDYITDLNSFMNMDSGKHQRHNKTGWLKPLYFQVAYVKAVGKRLLNEVVIPRNKIIGEEVMDRETVEDEAKIVSVVKEEIISTSYIIDNEYKEDLIASIKNWERYKEGENEFEPDDGFINKLQGD